MPIPLLKIATPQLSEGFSKKWTHKGVAIFQDAVHHQYAADFANMILTSFVEQQQKKAAVEAAKKKVVLTEGA